jgi:hypothetical protein
MQFIKVNISYFESFFAILDVTKKLGQLKLPMRILFGHWPGILSVTFYVQAQMTTLQSSGRDRNRVMS